MSSRTALVSNVSSLPDRKAKAKYTSHTISFLRACGIKLGAFTFMHVLGSVYLCTVNILVTNPGNHRKTVCKEH